MWIWALKKEVRASWGIEMEFDDDGLDAAGCGDTVGCVASQSKPSGQVAWRKGLLATPLVISLLYLA